jgi:hypothetical protein
MEISRRPATVSSSVSPAQGQIANRRSQEPVAAPSQQIEQFFSLVHHGAQVDVHIEMRTHQKMNTDAGPGWKADPSF